MFHSYDKANIVQLIFHTNLLLTLQMLAMGNTIWDTYIRNSWSYHYSQPFNVVKRFFSNHHLRASHSLVRKLYFKPEIIFQS
jgi:hypothetical protein